MDKVAMYKEQIYKIATNKEKIYKEAGVIGGALVGIPTGAMLGSVIGMGAGSLSPKG